MGDDRIGTTLEEAHRGRHLVRVRAINPSGNTVDLVGYVTAIRRDGGVRLHQGDPEHGQVHDFPASAILAAERVHRAT